MARDVERVRRELQARKPEPAIRGFMQVALNRYLSVAPVEKRDEILARFMRIDNRYDARLFIRESRQAVTAHKLVNPQRKDWKIRADVHTRRRRARAR